MPKRRMLSYEQARLFYDRLGAMQDTQGFYERAALADLVAHLDLSRAQWLIEFGCGSGRFAEELFDRYLSSTACYVGSLTNGPRGLSRVVSSAWEQLHRFSPMLVGGCRPITIIPLFEGLRWAVRHRNVVRPFGIASEIVVAEKR